MISLYLCEMLCWLDLLPFQENRNPEENVIAQRLLFYMDMENNIFNIFFSGEKHMRLKQKFSFALYFT